MACAVAGQFAVSVVSFGSAFVLEIDKACLFLLVMLCNVNILGGSINTVKENAEALVAATGEIGLEVSADKTSTWSCTEIRMQDEVTV